MNKKIEDLMYHAGLTAQGCWDEMDEYDRKAIEKFAELIVKECIKQCQQEWYDLNNTESDTLGDARAVAILVGQKNGILKSISGIKKQFGVEE